MVSRARVSASESVSFSRVRVRVGARVMGS